MINNKQTVQDKLNRNLLDLRISLTDRCNLRCVYCMPKEIFGARYNFLSGHDLLTEAEVIRLARIFIQLGVRKIRLTGGEPLLKKSIIKIISEIHSFSDCDLALTTNGTVLMKYAKDLKQAGLKRITVSLDTLNPALYRSISGDMGRIEKTLKGIEEANLVGFTNIKLNVVVIKGINSDEIVPIAKFARQNGLIARFIEYMDVGNTNRWELSKVYTAKQIFNRINEWLPLQKMSTLHNVQVAKMYEYQDRSGKVGIISSITEPFCQSCTRARITADGKLVTCLFSSKGRDLKTVLRATESDHVLKEEIVNLWKNRKDRYSELRGKKLVENGSKFEMHKLGG